MTVATHLEQISSKAILSAPERLSISTSISTLRGRLASYFGDGIREQFQFGSSTRGTILPRSIDSNSDIDYMVVFADTVSRPQTYLNRIRRFADSRYSTSEIFQSSPTIVLNLNHIKFELVPAIAPDYFGYSIPAPASGYLDWIVTYPNGFNANLTEVNNRYSSYVKPVIRLIKYWNAQRNYVFNSFLLEKSIVANIGWNWSFKEYFYSAFNALNLPWGSAQWREDQLTYAKRIIENTRQYEINNLPYTALSEIKKIIPEF